MMAKAPPMMTFSLPEEEQLLDVISKRTLVLRWAEDILCMSVKLDPDYSPMVDRIKRAIDSGKHWCALMSTEISAGLTLFLRNHGYSVNQWVVLSDPTKKWVYISWDWTSKIITFDSYSDALDENQDRFNLWDLPF